MMKNIKLCSGESPSVHKFNVLQNAHHAVSVIKQTIMLVTLVLGDQRRPLNVDESATASQLDALTRQTFPETPLGELKFIYQGRLISGRLRLVDLHVAEGAFIHVVSANPTAYAFNPVVDLEASGINVRNESSSTGFDRLHVLGLSEEDINVLRQTYLSNVVEAFPPSVLPLLPGEEEANRLKRAEDEWMKTQSDASEFMLNLRPIIMRRNRFYLHPVTGRMMVRPRRRRNTNEEAGEEGEGGEDEEDEEAPPWMARSSSMLSANPSEGTLSNFLVGLMLGSFFGVIMLLFALNARSPRRFRLGLLLGIGLSLFLRYSILSSSTDANPNDGGSSVSPPSAPLVPMNIP
jgi:DUF2407 C-terminal domain/Ubiquitin family